MGYLPAGQQVTRDEVTDAEAGSPARVAVITWTARLAPLDLGDTGELESAAGGERSGPIPKASMTTSGLPVMSMPGWTPSAWSAPAPGPRPMS